MGCIAIAILLTVKPSSFFKKCILCNMSVTFGGLTDLQLLLVENQDYFCANLAAQMQDG
jgi:hypothetical protein